MPNWCENDLTLEGPKTTLDRIVAERFSYDGSELCLDFQKVIPHNRTRVSLDAAWGTNRPACYPRPMQRRPKHLTQTFSTAWAPPLPVLEQLSKQYPNVKVTVLYFEAGMGFSGAVIFKAGKIVSQAANDNYSGSRGG